MQNIFQIARISCHVTYVNQKRTSRRGPPTDSIGIKETPSLLNLDILIVFCDVKTIVQREAKIHNL